MTSVASGGAADRIAARILFKVVRAGSRTPARYSSTFFGATLPFAAESRLPEFAFFIRVILTPVPVIQYLFLRKHESHGGLSMLTSGRRRDYSRRPPTPPDVRFRIRRFMKPTRSAAGYPAAKPTPCGRTKTWDRLRACARRCRSTTDLFHWWPTATPVAHPAQPASGSSPVCDCASLAATAGSAVCV